MASALAIHILVYRWVRGRNAPLFDDRFHLPTLKTIDDLKQQIRQLDALQAAFTATLGT